MSFGSTSDPAVGDRSPLRPGQSYLLEDRGSGERLEVRCESCEQRHWSRVGQGQVSRQGHDADGVRVFLKQYVDRAGRWHERLWRQDLDGAAVAGEILKGSVHVPAAVGVNESHLLSAFEHYEVISMDVLLRRDAAAFRCAYPAALEAVASCLEVMRSGVAPTGLATKSRGYEGLGNAVTFKGLDFRNMGWRTDRGDAGAAPKMVIFDFGQPYCAPVEEAAAKLLVSIGLLNWGRPMNRFLRGPDHGLLDAAAKRLRPYVHRDALRAEIELQRSFRTREIHATSRLQRAMKHWGIASIGRRYLRHLEAWAIQATN